MTARQLTGAFDRWRQSGQSMVLASVYETAGSTYSKTGAQMLINADGDFQGMLSGGCLEGDLAERAREVLETSRSQMVTYDLGQNDEELWGLGVGCDGLMRIFLQPLHADNNYEPFNSMTRIYAGDATGFVATVVESRQGNPGPGASLVSIAGQALYSDFDRATEKAVARVAAGVFESGRSQTVVLPWKSGNMTLLCAILKPPPRVLVLGAGLDARPVVRLIGELGWRVIVQDHRPAYIAAATYSDAEQVLCVSADELDTHVRFDRIDAAIVMSHHLATDRKYLELLAGTRIRYIGLLGPPNRRKRLVSELGDCATGLAGRLYGPAGIDIGATGPASIALSIVAQMHDVLIDEAAQELSGDLHVFRHFARQED